MAEGFHVEIPRARTPTGLNREIDYNQYFTVVRKHDSKQYAPVRERAADVRSRAYRPGPCDPERKASVHHFHSLLAQALGVLA